MSKPIILTASSAAKFRTCRRQYYWRQVRELVLAREDESESLWFGRIWHACREAWLLGRVFVWPTPANHRERELLLRARAMDSDYQSRWAGDLGAEWMPEVEFRRPLIVAGRRRYGFELAGKIDALAGDSIMEHKTAADVDAGYIERLPLDSQILTYAMATGCRTVVYDVAIKPELRLGQGETAEEFEVRRAELQAKSKTGKPSKASQWMAETDAEYLARLAPKIQFVRETLLISESDIDQHAAELYELAQQIRDAGRAPGLAGWYRNSGACANYGRTCAYLPLCRVCHPERVIDSGQYTHKAANEELSFCQQPKGVLL